MLKNQLLLKTLTIKPKRLTKLHDKTIIAEAPESMIHYENTENFPNAKDTKMPSTFCNNRERFVEFARKHLKLTELTITRR